MPKSASDIDQVIQKHLQTFKKTGVLTVRPGYEITGDHLTGKPAVVVTVHTKKKPADLAAGDALPDKVGGLPVDVREASAYQRLRARDPGSAAVAYAYARPEDAEPSWEYERELPSGQLLSKKPAPQHPAIKATSTKEPVHYTPPPNVPLVPVTDTMTLTAHVSPDAGLATLEKFLSQKFQSLVVGMYDFTSGPILKAFEAALDGGQTLDMVLDDPAPNPTRNQTDPQTVATLRAQLNGNGAPRADIAWALTSMDKLASAVLATGSSKMSAYHIKVIVQDGVRFWLSSGNLNNSNQPDLSNPPHTEDRDWHIIVENAQLAQTFQKYIENDLAVAKQHQAAAGATASVQDSVADARLKLAAEENPPPPAPLPVAPAKKPVKGGGTGPVAPLTVTKSVTVTPLLTPDILDGKQGEYISHILDLINSAKSKFYMQQQYIEPPGTNTTFAQLHKAIRARAADGVEVKLIVSQQYGMKWAEKMRDDPETDLTPWLYLQPDVHNKGFVVDSATCVVSSQNWSPSGVLTNRDAGLIIADSQISQYYEAVFLSDVANKAKPFSGEASGTVHVPTPRRAAKTSTKKPVLTRKAGKSRAVK
jgi:phosphatidylserine/phosphatidylglycerophosphate/cardiolipin synthase-like enzyme